MNNCITERLRGVLVRVFFLDTAKLPDELNVETIEQWDSLGHLTLIAELEAEFSIQFDRKKLFGYCQNLHLLLKFIRI